MVGVRGTPERDYVVPGCGRGRDRDRRLVVMSRRRRPWVGGGVKTEFLHERALQKSPRIVKHAFFGQNFGARQMQALK